MNHTSITPHPTTQPLFYENVPTKRLMAWAVDAGIIATMVLCVIVLTAGFGLFFFAFLVFSISTAYRIITIANGSATLGMRFFAIELRTTNGQRLDLQLAFWHTAGYVISCMMAPLQLISIVLMASSVTGQGLTDRFIGTVMLNKRGRI